MWTNPIIAFLIVSFAASSFSFAQTVSPAPALPKDSYVGDEACRSCHADKSASFLLTSHHLTSQLPAKNTIAGKFDEGQNILKTSNPELYFKMEANEHGFFQTALAGIPPYTIPRTERIDLVIGSGGKGQTYLYWKNDLLFQLPVSYWTELKGWANSPGYRDGSADFRRPIPPRCLDCHATYFKSLAPPPNRYAKTGFVLGISCEKCHGPGSEHVALQRSKAPASSGEAIVNPARLSRDRQMDVCALCHAGLGELTAAPFSYVPGEPLDQYLKLPSLDPNAHVDVHGSQVELLKKSRCYQSSESMTCSTCHNVHEVQRDLAAFSARCLSCHKVENCGVFPKMGKEIAHNCIDCHMPEQQTDLIVADTNGRKVKPEVRNHWIKVYPVN